MRKHIRFISRSLAAVLILLLVFSIMPAAQAAGSGKPVLCVGFREDGEVETVCVGLPVTQDGKVLVISNTAVIDPDVDIYLCDADDEPYLLTLEDQDPYAVLFSSPDLPASICYPLGTAEIGEKCTMTYYDSDLNLHSTPLEISEYSSTPNSAGYYPMDGTYTGNLQDPVSPIAVVNSSGALVAFAGSDGVLGIYPPSGASSGPAPADPAPADPAPADPAPADPAPADPPVSGSSSSGTARGGSSSSASRSGSQINRSLVIKIVVIGVMIGVGCLIAGLQKKKKKPASGQLIHPDSHVSGGSSVDDLSATKPSGAGSGSQTVGSNQFAGWEPVPPQAPTAPQLMVSMLKGPLAGRKYPIGAAPILIGRSEEATIRFPADTKGVSRKHCQVFLNQGTLMIQDLGSTSGTFVGAHGTLTPNVPVPVSDGEIIYLGSHSVEMTIRFE